MEVNCSNYFHNCLSTRNYFFKVRKALSCHLIEYGPVKAFKFSDCAIDVKIVLLLKSMDFACQNMTQIIKVEHCCCSLVQIHVRFSFKIQIKFYLLRFVFYCSLSYKIGPEGIT
jgi:hypothetical protein